jgi:hypothetical protein
MTDMMIPFRKVRFGWLQGNCDFSCIAIKSCPKQWSVLQKKKEKKKEKKNSTFKSPALNSVLSRRFGCAPKIQKDKPALKWLVVQVSDHTSQK